MVGIDPDEYEMDMVWEEIAEGLRETHRRGAPAAIVIG